MTRLDVLRVRIFHAVSASALICLVGVMSGAAVAAWAAPDLRVKEIRFSNDAPTEGDPVTITAVVENIGADPVTHNQDVDVWFFEGDPDTGALQIQAIETLAGLAVGDEAIIRAKFRPRAGRFDIHAFVNPDPAGSRVQESDRLNNEATRTLMVAGRTFPRATEVQMQDAVDRAVQWVLDHQGELVIKCPQGGTENPTIVPQCIICGLSLSGLPVFKNPSPAWSPTESGPAATSLAITALIAGGLDASHPALAAAMKYILERDWNIFDVYDLAVVILALVATDDREAYFSRVEFAANRLADKQLRIERGHRPADDGGWGYAVIGDGAHMQYVIYALYTAKQWGIQIPQVVLTKAEQWVRRTQHSAGGWNYNLTESPWAEGPYGSMTATGIMALKALGAPATDAAIQTGVQWILDHYTLTTNAGSFYWHYYYLLAIQRAMDVPSAQSLIGEHDWYQEMADVFVATQHRDGRWEEIDGETFAATCFGILFLTRYVPEAWSPDISVVPGTIRFTPEMPTVGTPVSAQFTLLNAGKPLEDPLVDVAIFEGLPEKGGRLLATQQVFMPAGRSDATATATWRADTEGEFEIVVVADPDSKLAELGRANNVHSATLRVMSADASPEERAPMREIAPDVFAIGSNEREVIVDRKANEIRVSGQVWAATGLVEYLATGELGKVHETVLTLSVEPIHLQTALLLLGLEPENNLRTQGDGRVPKGAPVDLWVSWDGISQPVRAEELVLNVHEQRPMARTHWVFTGSRFDGPLFRADASRSLIATYRDPDAILNHPLPSGADDGAFRSNLALLPPKPTPITLTIRPIHVQ